MPLRYYQRTAVSRTIFGWDVYDDILGILGTGGGKTRIGAEVIRLCLPGRTLWLADQDELCAQPLRTITREANIIPSLEKGSRRGSKLSQVVVGSSQTLCRGTRLQEWARDHFDYLIIDEAHRGLERDIEIADHFETAKLLGLTATPFRVDLMNLNEYYQHTAFDIPLHDRRTGNGLIQQGFAPPIKHLVIPLEIDLKDVGSTGDDYNDEDLDRAIKPYYKEIIRLLAIHAPDRRILVFLPLRASSKTFRELAREGGFLAEHVDSSSPDREELIEGFARGRSNMLCNAGVISTGVDIPAADCFVNLRPTKSMSWYQQAFGRVCRPLPDVIDDLTEEHQAEERKARIAASAKPDCMVIDFLFLHDELTIHAGHLVSESEEEARRIFDKSKKSKTPEELDEIANRVLLDREKAVIKRLEFAGEKAKRNIFSPEQIAALTGDKHILHFSPSRQSDLDPPTAQQTEWLAKRGVDLEAVPNKGLASLLISRFMCRFQNHLATIPQLNYLRELGINQHDLTISEASRILDAAKKALR